MIIEYSVTFIHEQTCDFCGQFKDMDEFNTLMKSARHGSSLFKGYVSHRIIAIH